MQCGGMSSPYYLSGINFKAAFWAHLTDVAWLERRMETKLVKEEDQWIASWVREAAILQALTGALHCIWSVINPTHGWSAYFMACQLLRLCSSALSGYAFARHRNANKPRNQVSVGEMSNHNFPLEILTVIRPLDLIWIMQSVSRPVCATTYCTRSAIDLWGST